MVNVKMLARRYGKGADFFRRNRKFNGLAMQRPNKFKDFFIHVNFALACIFIDKTICIASANFYL